MEAKYWKIECEASQEIKDYVLKSLRNNFKTTGQYRKIEPTNFNLQKDIDRTILCIGTFLDRRPLVEIRPLHIAKFCDRAPTGISDITKYVVTKLVEENLKELKIIGE